VKAGDPILIDDGKVRLRVTEVKDGTDVICEVLVGGKVSNHKGINLPGVAVSVPALSEKDMDDLRFALHLTVDFIALSFVRSAADVEDVRRIMREENISLPVIAKIEKPQAIENLDEVIAAFDGFMVARGDLGVECPAEEVPFLQKTIIDKARLNAKPVIVATQMLESMITSPSPTRAEVSDVANAILDGADAVMLSGETGVGEYPVVAVETMARIIMATEDHAMEQKEVGTLRTLHWDPHTKSGVIAKAAGEVAERIDAKYVVAFTQSGDSARRMSRLRGPVPILAFTPEAKTRSQLSLSWGVETFKTLTVEHTDEMVAQVDEQLLNIGRVEKGDLVVIIAGSPPGIPGSTNALRVHRMGDAVDGFAPAYRRDEG
jgi:pyruvate kinase